MAKHRTGHLFKRGNAFYLRWTVNKKVFSRALRDDDGNSITNLRQAEDAKTKAMASFVVADEATALESIVAKLSGRKAELVRLEKERNPALPISQAWNRFLSSPNRPDSGKETLYQYECQFSAFTEWMQEKHPEIIPLCEVTRDIAKEYAGKLSGSNFSPNTFNKHIALLTLVFRVLEEEAGLQGNPWEKINRKRLQTRSRRELTVEELKTVCQSATGELQVLFGLGVYSSLRLGDCATLRWCEVDLLRKLITRIPNKTARRNSSPVVVPIHPVLLEMLSLLHANKKAGGVYVLPEMAGLYHKRTDLVTDIIQNHIRKCGINPHAPGTGIKGGKRAVIEVGFHSLRHTFVSLCRNSNAPLSVVESLVGHSSPAMTRHYTHVGDLAKERAVACLPSFVGAEVKTVTPEETQRELLKKAKTLLEGMTPENWKVTQEQLLSLLGANDATAEIALLPAGAAA